MGKNNSSYNWGYRAAKACMSEGGEVKAAVHKHEKAMHSGKPLTKLNCGGKVKK